MADDKTWLDFRHPEYQRRAREWQKALDHYNGRCRDAGRIREYIVQRGTAETEKAYEERLRLAHFKPLMATAVDALVGMLFSAEEQANYVTVDDKGNGLGDRKNPKTLAGRLERNADGSGAGRVAMMKRLARYILVCDTPWAMVDVAGEMPVYRVFSPLSVVNWREVDGEIVEALIEEEHDMRTSIMDNAQPGKRYLHLRLDGWQRFVKGEKGVAEDNGPGGFGTYRYVDREGRALLPLFRVASPFNRPLGSQWADEQNAIWNKKSQLDHLLRNSSWSILNFMGDAEALATAAQSMNAGFKALTNDPTAAKAHHFISADTASAEVQLKVLQDDTNGYKASVFQQFGDAAKEKSATQIQHEGQSGVGAALQLLKGVVDDAENGLLDRIAQAKYSGASAPADKRHWFVARIERSDTFAPLNPDAAAAAASARAFGTKDTPGAPLGRTARIAVAKEIAGYAGVEPVEEEIAAELDLRALKDVADLALSLGVDKVIPAAARVEIAMRLLRAGGLVTETDKVRLDDGTEVSKYDAWKREAEDLAEAADVATQAAGRLDAGGPGVGPDPLTEGDPGAQNAPAAEQDASAPPARAASKRPARRRARAGSEAA